MKDICEMVSKNPMDYVRVALAIETLAYHNKNYLWTGDNCKLSEEIQALLATALKKEAPYEPYNLHNKIVVQFAGTQDDSKTIYIDNVSEYFVDSGNKVLTVITNGRKLFFNFSLMFYVGWVDNFEKEKTE